MEQKIVVLGTGGTIAGTAAQPGDNIGYQAAQVGVGALLAGVPGLQEAAGVLVVEQVAQIDSKDMDGTVWQALALRCAAHLADPEVASIVITHGTDTLEETAWFLSQVLQAHKPVVLTSAMRPATALVPDGPQNLLDAVDVARTPGAQGVLAVAAGEVHCARHVQKVHPYRINAFMSGDIGPLGFVEEGRLRLVRNWPRVSSNTGLGAIKNIASKAVWPAVEIVMSHAGATGRVVDALVRDGVQGLVVACTGNGTVHQSLEDALVRAQACGVRVVRASRCPLGRVLPGAGDRFVDSDGLSPVKARISLILELLRQEEGAALDAACKG